MTALTASYDTKRKDGELIRYPVAAGAHVFKGALVCVTTATGYLAPAADAAGVVFAGVAYEEGNNLAGAEQYDETVTSGAAGAVSVRVQKTGVYQYHKTSAVQADVGKPAFVLDDNTVSTAATTDNVRCGVVVGLVDTGTVAVRIDEAVS